MRIRFFAAVITLATGVSIYAQDSQPKQGEKRLIDEFVTTRGASFGQRPTAAASSDAAKSTSKPNATNVANKGKAKRKDTGGAKGGTGKVKPPVETASAVGTKAGARQQKVGAGDGITNGTGVSDRASGVGASPIGLGYTILLVGDGGSNTVVDSSTEFARGDKIRIALETNADGYLYIFNAENGLNPIMLFPHAQLDEGANRIAAHARDFFPADLRFSFEFDETASTEHVYVIFSRRLLPDVPAGGELLKFCGQKSDDCYWKPSPDHWERIKAATASGRVVESQNKDLAKAQPGIVIGSRGIKVKKDEPAPAVVRMNASAESDALLTKIELVHK